MNWIESHDDLGDHWKTHTLCLQLKCDVATAVGYLHLLWHYTLKVAWRDGDLQRFPPHEIARACRFDGRSNEFLESLQTAGFLDGMQIHEWNKYAKHIIYQRVYNEKRKLQKRCKSNVTAGSKHEKKSATLPNLTLPNHKDKDLCKSFETFWEAYPKKRNRKNAFAKWLKLSPDQKLLETMLAALAAQKLSEQWQKNGGEFIPLPTTWLNGERWNDELKANSANCLPVVG